MPWPLSKARPTPLGNGGDDIGSVSLEDTGFNERRSASMDIPRPLNKYHVTSIVQDSKKERRSSFPRLAMVMPSWRSSADVSSKERTQQGQFEAGVDEVELQFGHGTPYSINGLKGGFAPDDVGSTSRGSSLRSASIRSSYNNHDEDAYGNREEVDEQNESGSWRTGGSGRTRVFVSPNLTPVDSGFSDFGPDSLVQAELDRLHDKASRTVTEPQPEAAASAEPVAAKRKSKGWFSFTASANVPSPTAEDLPSLSIPEGGTLRESATHPNAIPTIREHAATSTFSPLTKEKDRKPAVSSTKSRLGFRRRGNSEVSMKDFSEV